MWRLGEGKEEDSRCWCEGDNKVDFRMLYLEDDNKVDLRLETSNISQGEMSSSKEDNPLTESCIRSSKNNDFVFPLSKGRFT